MFGIDGIEFSIRGRGCEEGYREEGSETRKGRCESGGYGCVHFKVVDCFLFEMHVCDGGVVRDAPSTLQSTTFKVAIHSQTIIQTIVQ